jgi:hypothetical protein
MPKMATGLSPGFNPGTDHLKATRPEGVGRERFAALEGGYVRGKAGRRIRRI